MATTHGRRALCSSRKQTAQSDEYQTALTLSFNRYGLDGDYEWAPGFVFDPTRDICAAPYANFDIQGQATDTYSSMQASTL